ncbi:MAG: lipoprotein [Sulfurimonas sp.]|nr:lipoprotein [Sulfurimonas sp.]MDD3059546.1 lipoprotein [Sulfurimonas sp.]MDD5202185.1 lipoprotein [Sulfurimonas sp.]
MNRVKYLRSVFHPLIIAIFLFGLSGCGYKGAPFYTKELEQSDEDVAFILQKQPQSQLEEKSVECE